MTDDEAQVAPMLSRRAVASADREGWYSCGLWSEVTKGVGGPRGWAGRESVMKRTKRDNDIGLALT